MTTPARADVSTVIMGSPATFMRTLRWVFSGLATLALALPLVASDYLVSAGFLVFNCMALASGWNLFSGYTGYPNLGYAAFVGLGAYVFAIGTTRFNWPWFTGVIAAAVACCLLAVLAMPVLRVRGAYFAIATLALAEGLKVLTSMPLLRPWTNGGVGLAFSPGLSLRGQYYLIIAVAGAAVAVTHRLATSRTGLRLLAIREDETAARALGIRADTLKLGAFVLSAGVGGVTGAVQAMYLTYIDPPSAFHINYTLLPMVMAAFGGLGTVWGPVFGSLALSVVNQAVNVYFLVLQYILFGTVLLVVTLYLPEGVIPRLQARSVGLRSRSL